MNRFFGKKKEEAPVAEAPSLTDVGTRVDGRVKAVEDKISALNTELKGYQAQLKRVKGSGASGIKQRALQALKRKKMYEQQRDQLLGQQFNIDQTSFHIESAKDTVEQVSAMKGAAVTLKATAQEMPDIDDIEDTMDDLAEQFEEMNEIQDSLGRSYGVGDDVDEADLESELAALEDEFDMDAVGEEDAMPAYLQPAAPAPAMPVAPSSDPVPAMGLPAAGAVDKYGLPVGPTASS